MQFKMLRTNSNLVAQGWDHLYDIVKRGLPADYTDHEFLKGNLLEQIMSEKMHLWSILVDDKLVAVVLTSVGADKSTMCKNLIIYSFVSVATLQRGVFEQGLNVLQRFAKAQNCMKIVAYTQSRGVSKLASGLGATVSAMLTWEV